MEFSVILYVYIKYGGARTPANMSDVGMSTGVSALRFAHSAMANCDTSVIFFENFWYQTEVQVDVLNTALGELSTWEAPMIMFPGNHDQVTLGGCKHGLTMPGNSYRVHDCRDDGDSTAAGTGGGGGDPSPLIFTRLIKVLVCAVCSVRVPPLPPIRRSLLPEVAVLLGSPRPRGIQSSV